ncbi:MAG: hypothetical protein J3Q66DRAFT_372195 [Benniella sp.]|nr:MAG: hypothetical protein J3Q66DRAFT_372195 [Benniella sp.]
MSRSNCNHPDFKDLSKGHPHSSSCKDPWEVFLWQAFSQPAKVEKKTPEPAPASTHALADQEDDDEGGEDDDAGGKSKNKKKQKKGAAAKEGARPTKKKPNLVSRSGEASSRGLRKAEEGCVRQQKESEATEAAPGKAVPGKKKAPAIKGKQTKQESYEENSDQETSTAKAERFRKQ